MFPLPEISKNYLILSISVLKKIFSYVKSIKFTLMIKSGRIKKYDIVFLGGTFGWQGIGRISKKNINNSEIVKVNSDDYDNYLEVKNTKTETSKKYILFLDEYLPFHPDTQLFKIKNVNRKSKLYKFSSEFKKEISSPTPNTY
jgi:hypothetical protein